MGITADRRINTFLFFTIQQCHKKIYLYFNPLNVTLDYSLNLLLNRLLSDWIFQLLIIKQYKQVNWFSGTE